MKKTLFAISAIAVLLGFTACTSENEIAEPQVSGKTILKAYTETSTTRTALEDDGEGGYNVVWSTGDKIYGDATGAFPGELTGAGGTTSGEFTITGDNNDIDGRTFFYGLEPNTDGVWSWPNEQTYADNTISFSPMAGKVSITGGEASATFKNLGGLLRLNLKGTAKITSVKISANEYMSGKFNGEPGPGEAAVIDNVDTKCFKSITLDCGAGVTLNESTATSFYIAMPANTTGYTGVTIELTDDEGKVCTKTFKGASGLKIERSMITSASFTASTFAYLPITASSPVGFIGTLNGRTGIVVNLGGSIGTVVIATMNVGATSVDEGNSCYGKYIYFKDLSNTSVTGLSNGWYVPSQDELQALANLTNKTWNETRKGYEWSFNETGTTLFLPAAGYEYPGYGVFQAGAHGVYSSTGGYGDNTAYPLSFDSGTCDISNSYQYGYSLRPFHAMPTE